MWAIPDCFGGWLAGLRGGTMVGATTGCKAGDSLVSVAAGRENAL